MSSCKNYTFYCISKYAGKGKRISIKSIYAMDENQYIVRTHAERGVIKQEISMHNTKHFQKAHDAIVCKDKIYAKLRKDKIEKRRL